jgi:hypothetical protein
MWTCIYCRHQSHVPFPSEHVIPKSLGTFHGNLTLHCVCRSCNNYFSGQLEIPFLRYSGESIVRYRHGLRESPAYGLKDERLKTSVTTPGPLKGAKVGLSPSKTGAPVGYD